MFHVLARDDSDDDHDKKKDKAPPVKKPTKKEERAIDQQLRDKYATDSLKTDSRKVKLDRPPKDDYESGEKRPYDRRSGTGRQAFGNNFKKQGHGLGNSGRFPREDDYIDSSKNLIKANEQKTKQELEETQKAVEKSLADGKPQEPTPEQYITLEEYVKVSGKKFGFEEEAQLQKKGSAPKAVVDPELKPIQNAKVPQEEFVTNKKKKDLNTALHAPANNLIESLPQGESFERKNSKVGKKNPRKEFNDNDFPPLGK